jgi:pimeloyl-ACP methyl ester carboxylesterase
MLNGTPTERRFYATSPWGQLHARVLGEGTPLVLLHQTPWTSLQYARVMPLLAAAGYQAIAPDTPGYGLSHGPDTCPSLEEYAAALLPMLDECGFEKIALLGHHTGALIATALAARWPARIERLIVHGLPLYTEAERDARLAAPHFDQTPKPDGSHFTDRWAHLERALGPGEAAVRHLAVLTFFENGPLEWYGHYAAFAYDVGPDVARLAVPTLCLSNTGDTIAAHAERLRGLRPDFQYTSLEGGTTQMMLEQPEAWATAVVDFLRRPLTA